MQLLGRRMRKVMFDLRLILFSKENCISLPETWKQSNLYFMRNLVVWIENLISISQL